MYFEDRNDILTVIELGDLEKDPDLIYRHFMRYGDEVFYILSNGKMHGIVTPGNLYRTYYCTGSKIPQPNTKFAYVERKDDEEKAKEIFKRFPTIHEVAVVENGAFLGVIKSGYRKSEEEWKDIRESFRNALCRAEWLRKDISRLLELNCTFYVYRCLRVDDMGLTEDERIIFEQKRDLLPTAEGIYALTKRERDVLFGNAGTAEYIDEWARFGRERQIVYTNGIPKYNDYHSAVVNICNGSRIVPNAPAHAQKKIFMIGPCTMFGGLADDGRTIEAYLQELLLKGGYSDYEVVNCSVTGDLSLPRLFREDVSEQDIVIIMSWDYPVWAGFEKEHKGEKLKCLESMSEIWREIEVPVDHVFNLAEHCSYIVHQKIAEKMFRDIGESLRTDRAETLQRRHLQDYYISSDVVSYYIKHFGENGIQPKMYAGGGRMSSSQRVETIGAAVMNCNPFTRGHRYLIEQAAKAVDRLYIFVVEEDRSEFSFQDRFEMVKRGTAGLENVRAIPSGEYIISSKTFSQYFTKDNVEEVADMDYDLHIFGEVVAKLLGIAYRFVGEEPFDRVTAKYNETMKALLPQHGVEVVEIPRLAAENGEIISASKVREYIHAGRSEELRRLLPDSTICYLQTRGNHL